MILLAVVVLGGLGAAAYFSPLMSARSVSVTGAVHAPPEEVSDVVEPLKGKPLLQISAGQRAQYARAVTAVSPWISSATVTVSYPSTLVVEVTERDAIAYTRGASGIRLVDATGLAFVKVPEPPILTPILTIDDPKPNDAATRAAIGVLTALPTDLHGQVAEIGADSPANVRIVLRDKRVVYWGDDSRTEAKVAALRVILTRPGKEYTVINPDIPTTR